MSKALDLTGQRFGRLIVRNRAEDHYTKSGRKIIMWDCDCDCGDHITVSTSHLRSGHTVSCGCKGSESLQHDILDLTGKKFGRLTVLGICPHEPGERVYWLCECDCGNVLKVTSNHLTSGHTKSCGCYRKENSGLINWKHGMAHEKIYGVYKAIKRRCYKEDDPNYKNYGGRGITVCEEWRNSFQEFYKWAESTGYQEGLTIDRIDTNGNYEPENCRWTDMKTQNNNRRNNHLEKYNGEYYTISQLSEISIVDYSTLLSRINAGWEIEKAVETPNTHEKFNDQNGDEETTP